jgi:hypothetical protein
MSLFCEVPHTEPDRKNSSLLILLQQRLTQSLSEAKISQRCALQPQSVLLHRSDRIQSTPRGIVTRNSRQQFSGAMIGFLAAMVVIALLVLNPFGLLPDLLRTILVALAFFAGAVLAFGFLGSMIFDWVPFVQDTTVYRALREMDLTIEAQPGEK